MINLNLLILSRIIVFWHEICASLSSDIGAFQTKSWDLFFLLNEYRLNIMKYWGIQKNRIIKTVCRIDMLEQSSIFYRCMIECNIRIRGYQKSVNLPSLQSGPFHPAEQLSGQDPSTWLHTSLLEHRPHIFSQCLPKYPLPHSEYIEKNILIFSKILINYAIKFYFK